MQSQKILIASGPVIVKNNKVLLDISGEDTFWKFCGGQANNLFHNLIEVAKERAKEELGINIKVINQEPFLMYTQKKTLAGNIDILLVHYLAKYSGKIIPANFVKKWDWIPLTKLKKDRFSTKDKTNSLLENLAPNIIPTLKHFKFIN